MVRDDVGAALSDVAAQVAGLGVALRALGLNEADLRTTGSTLCEEYGGSDPDGRPVSAGFRLGHLAWSVSDEVPLVDLARRAAYDDARDKAAKLAALADADLGRLIRVTESDGSSGGVPRTRAVKADVSFAAERGENRVAVSLSTRWALA